MSACLSTQDTCTSPRLCSEFSSALSKMVPCDSLLLPTKSKLPCYLSEFILQPCTYNYIHIATYIQYSIFNIQYYSSAPCAMHTRTGCPMQHYTEMRYWSDMRYNYMNWSAISGNQLWRSGTDKTQGTQAQPYKLGTLQESAYNYYIQLPLSLTTTTTQCKLHECKWSICVS